MRAVRRKILQRIKELLGLKTEPVTVAAAYGAQTPLTHQTGCLPATPSEGYPGAACLSFALTPTGSVQPSRLSGSGHSGVGPVLSDIPLPAIPCNVPLPPLPPPGEGVEHGSVDGPEDNAENEASEAARQAAEAEALRLRNASTELTAEVKEKMQAEDFCVNEGQWATKKLQDVLQANVGWAIPGMREAMLKELKGLSEKMQMPGCSVVTVGDTGAGKSTLLNALLGETSVLPTNGMRACTASIIELVRMGSPSLPCWPILARARCYCLSVCEQAHGT